MTTVNRRDFLLLKREAQAHQPKLRTLELSCERLYMRWMDSQTTAVQREASAEAQSSIWGGEPPTIFVERTWEEWLADLERELHEADVLHVVHSHWLIGDLRLQFDPLLDGFRARGGTVRFV